MRGRSLILRLGWWLFVGLVAASLEDAGSEDCAARNATFSTSCVNNVLQSHSRLNPERFCRIACVSDRIYYQQKYGSDSYKDEGVFSAEEFQSLTTSCGDFDTILKVVSDCHCITGPRPCDVNAQISALKLSNSTFPTIEPQNSTTKITSRILRAETTASKRESRMSTDTMKRSKATYTTQESSALPLQMPSNISENFLSRLSNYSTSAPSSAPTLPAVPHVKKCPNDATKVWKKNCLTDFEERSSGSAMMACNLLCKPDYTTWSDDDYVIYADLVDTCHDHNWAILALMEGCGCITPNHVGNCELPKEPPMSPILSSVLSSKASTSLIAPQTPYPTPVSNDKVETKPSEMPQLSGSTVKECPSDSISKWPEGNCLSKVFYGKKGLEAANSVCQKSCGGDSDKHWPNNLIGFYKSSMAVCKSPSAITEALKKGCGCLNVYWVSTCVPYCEAPPSYDPTEKPPAIAPSTMVAPPVYVSGSVPVPDTLVPTDIYMPTKISISSNYDAGQTISAEPDERNTSMMTDENIKIASTHQLTATLSKIVSPSLSPTSGGWIPSTYSMGNFPNTMERITYSPKNANCCTVPNKLPRCTLPPGKAQHGWHHPMCNQWYMVQLGDTCQNIVEKIRNGASANDIIEWNEAAQPDCKYIWAERYICVSILKNHRPSGGGFFNGYTPATSRHIGDYVQQTMTGTPTQSTPMIQNPPSGAYSSIFYSPSASAKTKPTSKEQELVPSLTTQIRTETTTLNPGADTIVGCDPNGECSQPTPYDGVLTLTLLETLTTLVPKPSNEDHEIDAPETITCRAGEDCKKPNPSRTQPPEGYKSIADISDTYEGSHTNSMDHTGLTMSCRKGVDCEAPTTTTTDSMYHTGKTMDLDMTSESMHHTGKTMDCKAGVNCQSSGSTTRVIASSKFSSRTKTHMVSTTAYIGEEDEEREKDLETTTRNETEEKGVHPTSIPAMTTQYESEGSATISSDDGDPYPTAVSHSDDEDEPYPTSATYNEDEEEATSTKSPRTTKTLINTIENDEYHTLVVPSSKSRISRVSIVATTTYHEDEYDDEDLTSILESMSTTFTGEDEAYPTLTASSEKESRHTRSGASASSNNNLTLKPTTITNLPKSTTDYMDEATNTYDEDMIYHPEATASSYLSEAATSKSSSMTKTTEETDERDKSTSSPTPTSKYEDEDEERPSPTRERDGEEYPSSTSPVVDKPSSASNTLAITSSDEDVYESSISTGKAASSHKTMARETHLTSTRTMQTGGLLLTQTTVDKVDGDPHPTVASQTSKESFKIVQDESSTEQQIQSKTDKESTYVTEEASAIITDDGNPYPSEQIAPITSDYGDPYPSEEASVTSEDENSYPSETASPTSENGNTSAEVTQTTPEDGSPYPSAEITLSSSVDTTRSYTTTMKSTTHPTGDGDPYPSEVEEILPAPSDGNPSSSVPKTESATQRSSTADSGSYVSKSTTMVPTTTQKITPTTEKAVLESTESDSMKPSPTVIDENEYDNSTRSSAHGASSNTPEFPESRTPRPSKPADTTSTSVDTSTYATSTEETSQSYKPDSTTQETIETPYTSGGSHTAETSNDKLPSEPSATTIPLSAIWTTGQPIASTASSFTQNVVDQEMAGASVPVEMSSTDLDNADASALTTTFAPALTVTDNPSTSTPPASTNLDTKSLESAQTSPGPATVTSEIATLENTPSDFPTPTVPATDTNTETSQYTPTEMNVNSESTPTFISSSVTVADPIETTSNDEYPTVTNSNVVSTSMNDSIAPIVGPTVADNVFPSQTPEPSQTQQQPEVPLNKEIKISSLLG